MGRTSGSGNGGDGGNADLVIGFVGIVRSSHQIVVQVAMPQGSFGPLARLGHGQDTLQWILALGGLTRKHDTVGTVGLATSEISAGVGRGFLMIDFIIWVAPRHRAMIEFWARNTSVGISIPRSLRAVLSSRPFSAQPRWFSYPRSNSYGSPGSWYLA